MNNFSNILDVPLIPEPIDGLELVTDVYIGHHEDAERWRSYMDYENWDPKSYNNELIQKKMYHARVYLETTILLSVTPSDWLICEQLKSIQELSSIHLRRYEFDLVGFQLMTGNIAIKTTKTDRDQLRITAAIMFSTISWWLNQMKGDNPNLKASKKTIQQWKPISVESARTYAESIDNMVETLRILLKLELTEEHFKNPKHFKMDLGTKLRNCIIHLDKVLVVL